MTWCAVPQPNPKDTRQRYCVWRGKGPNVMRMETAARHNVCHQDCLMIHALADAEENFQDSTGIDLNDLSLWADREDVVRWDTITTASNAEQVREYLISVAADYLNEGTSSCQREED